MNDKIIETPTKSSVRENTGTITTTIPNKGNTNGVLIIVTVIGFILVFTYMSLNLKNRDYGYEIHKLVLEEERLKEDIDKLRSEKAGLLNLKRVEQLVINKLGYQYPTTDQFIKVYEEKQ